QAHKIITFRDDGRRDLGSASATASADLQSSSRDKLETQYLQRLESYKYDLQGSNRVKRKRWNADGTGVFGCCSAQPLVWESGGETLDNLGGEQRKQREELRASRSEEVREEILGTKMNDKRSDGPWLVEGIVNEKTTCSETKNRDKESRNDYYNHN
ncbi:hypothetical protein GBF38_009785, partial [Nibea albiflora]